MKKRLLSMLLVICMVCSLFPAIALTAGAAEGDLPTILSVEPSATNGIPARIDVFKTSSSSGGGGFPGGGFPGGGFPGGGQGGGTTTPGGNYDLYLPGNVDSTKCFFSWADGLQATVDGQTYASGACPIPAPGETKTYTFTKGSDTATFTVTTYQGSATVKAIFIDIDESKGTIAAMDGDPDHETSCSGVIYIDGVQFVMSKIKGRGNYTWSQARDKKAYNISLDTKVSILGIDCAPTKKWSILAEVADHSLLCNRAGFALAHQMDVGQDTASADVWMNGEYQGCYTVTPKYDSYVTKDGFLIENDNYKESLTVAEGGDPQFALEGLDGPGNNSQWGGGGSDYNLITCKGIGDNLLAAVGDDAEKAAAQIKAWLQDAWDAIRSEDGYNSKGKYYTDYVDIESFAKMYLMHDYVKSYDVCAGSILFHRDGNTDDYKLIAGPIWDLDNAMGSTQSNMSLGSVGDRRSGKGAFITQIQEYKTSIYKTIGRHEDFMEEVYRQYNLNKAAFDALPNTVQAMADDIRDSAMMNHNKVESVNYNNHSYSRDTTLEGGTEYEQNMKATSNNKTDWPNYVNNLKEYVKARSLWFANTYAREDEGFVATINAGQGTTVTTYAKQADAEGDQNGVEGEKYVYATDPVTGEITKDGNGQVNFRVKTTPPYVLDGVTAEPAENYEKIETVSEGLYRVTKVTGPISVKIASSELLCEHEFNADGVCTKCGMEAYKVTFDCDEHCTVTAFDSSDVTGAGHPNAAFAFARNKDTGEIDVTGSGQLYFVVNVDEGYAVNVEHLVGEPKNYNKVKDPADANVPNSFGITKIEGSFVLHVTTMKVGDPNADYFADGSFDESAWEILNPDTENYSVETGKGIVMPTQRYDIYSTGAAWKNCFVTPTEGDWKAVTKAVYPKVPTQNYQQAMMLVWQDEDNYIRINCQQSNLSIQPGKETNGSFSSSGFQQPRAQAAEDGSVTLYWMIDKTGTTYTLSYSQDGLNFTELGSTTAEYEAPKIGLFATSNTDQGANDPVDVYFEYLAVLGHNGIEEVTPAEMLDWAAQNVADYIFAALPATQVDGDLVLPPAPHGYSVEVVCDHPEIIDAEGKFTKPATDTQVSVSLSVTEGDVIATTAKVKLLAKGDAAAVVPIATFVTDEHCSVTSYDTSDLSGEGHPNATSAQARDKSTGNPLEGGQVWFVVNVDEGYEIDSVTVDPKNYNKINNPADEAYPTSYNLTKVVGDITITVTTKAAGVQPVVDKTALNEAVIAAEAVDKSKYTDATVAALEAALASAKAVQAAEDADQAAVDAAAEALQAAINGLEEKPVPQPAGKYVLAEEFVPGGTYVIVADGAYALNGQPGDTTLGATAVTIEGNVITSEVTADMLWTFGAAEGADAAADGNDMYLISSADGQNLRRGSGSNTPPLSLGEYNVTDQRFYTWSLTAREAEEDAYTLYLNGSTGRYYAMVGAETGFNTLYASAWDPQTTGSSIKLYEPAAGGSGLPDIDFTDPADADKYEIAGQSESAVEEGVGLALVSSQGGIEPAKQNIAEADIDVVKVPVSGDWTATLEVEFDANGAANGYYQFFGFVASQGKDNQNLVGIRGGDGAIQDFIRKDGAITEEQNSSTPGFDTSGKTYYLRIEKEGDAYTCYRSDDGEAFTQMFAYEGTGIEADELLIDAYTGMTAGYKFTLKSLKFEGGEVTPVVDKTALNNAIAAAEAIDKDAYTEASVAAMEEALAAAQAALASNSQAEIDAAAAALNEAVAALEPATPGTFRVTFVCGEGATIDVLKTQTLDGEIFENVTTAVPRNKETFEEDYTGEGQVNFVVKLAEGYELDGEIAAEGGYKNLKGPEDTTIENGYRITKITDNVTVTVNTKKGDSGDCEHEFTAESIPATCTEPAKIRYTCSKCGYWYEEVGSAAPEIEPEINVPSSATTERSSGTYGRKESITYYSTTAGRNKKANVQLPANYDPNKKYPVMYLLHGVMGSENDMVGNGTIIQNLVADGLAEEMIIVCPNMWSSATSASPNGINQTTMEGYDRFHLDLVNDLMPYMAEHYSVAEGKENTAVCGFSQGGRETLLIGLYHPDVIGYLCAISSAPGIVAATDNYMSHPGVFKEEEIKYEGETPYLIMMTSGDNDTVVGKNPQEYHRIYTENGIAHTWWEIPGANHGGATSSGVYNFAKYAFKVQGQSEPLGHDWDEGVVTEPSCTQEGYTAFTCKRCGEVEKRDLKDKLPHNYVDGVCTVCGEKLINVTIEADEGVTVTVLETQAADGPKTENAAAANPRSGDTGLIDCSGDGQVNFIVNVADGYELESVTADPADSYKNLKGPDDTGIENGYRITKITGDLTIQVKAKKTGGEPFLFEDVKDPGKFYFDPVYWAYYADPQITKGTDDTHFGPDNACTRGHVVTFLWRAAGEPEPKSTQTPFTDLKPGAFYEKAVAWAVEEGITKGMTDTTFAPDGKCNRGQIVTFLWRFKGEPAPKSTQTPFTDLKAGAFYENAVAWAVENDVTKGMTETTFGPDATCTRGQVVTFLYRATAE